ncbi:MAG TPA: hypothetical protein VFJ97_15790 [Dermatophilaceae bacterium]|nr:hypothetical protein [Dermatophilaceae bacterium]
MSGPRPTLPSAAAAVGLLLAGLTGCSVEGPGSDGARAAAVNFHRLLTAGNGERACRLLSERAVEDVRGPDDRACATALTSLPIRPVAAVRSTSVYGHSALVVFDADAVFLASFDDGWRVTAAGCSPRQDQPYDCAFEAG